jgi:CheY-like chemotaxis protein
VLVAKEREGSMSSGDRIRVLHVEDGPAFARLAAQLLEQTDDAIEVESVLDPRKALDPMQIDPVDCVVCDYEMPGVNGLEVLDRVRKSAPKIPFILFTGKGSEEITSEAISAGVTDYLCKDRPPETFEVLAYRVRHAVEAERRRRRLAERDERLNRQSSLLRGALDALGDVFYVLTPDGKLDRWNSELADLTGYSDEELDGMPA